MGDSNDPRSWHLHPPPEDPEAGTGCVGALSRLGLALYAVLVLTVAGAAFTCAFGAMIGRMFVPDPTPEAGALTGGTTTEAWRFVALRRAGLLGAAETPALYHDHSPANDGSAGCAVLSRDAVKGVLRWDDLTTTAWVPLRGATATWLADAGVVRIDGPDVGLDCPFRPGEEGERFARLLQTDIGFLAREPQ